MIGIFPMKAADTCLTETMLERKHQCREEATDSKALVLSLTEEA